MKRSFIVVAAVLFLAGCDTEGPAPVKVKPIVPVEVKPIVLNLMSGWQATADGRSQQVDYHECSPINPVIYSSTLRILRDSVWVISVYRVDNRVTSPVATDTLRGVVKRDGPLWAIGFDGVADSAYAVVSGPTDGTTIEGLTIFNEQGSAFKMPATGSCAVLRYGKAFTVGTSYLPEALALTATSLGGRSLPYVQPTSLRGGYAVHKLGLDLRADGSWHSSVTRYDNGVGPTVVEETGTCLKGKWAVLLNMDSAFPKLLVRKAGGWKATGTWKGVETYSAEMVVDP